ncbi:hypothetical protein KIW84_057158 [Lathyrus oleraceus]|uniref:Uncharacterized protein n=1 Tax=Pisum sativum TaxID=3888 RepID=A0A9D4X088_PEA|nr:hypothetical protein KIW84_057158 [Pisum sativum]
MANLNESISPFKSTYTPTSPHPNLSNPTITLDDIALAPTDIPAHTLPTVDIPTASSTNLPLLHNPTIKYPQTVGHISPQCPKPKKENQSGGKVFALSGSETSADDRLIRGTLW